MDPIFEHLVFDSSREKMKRFIRQLEKHRKPLKTHCTLVSYVEAVMFFLLQNRSGLLTKERLYSTSVEIVTINGEMDKQRLSESKKTHEKNNHLIYDLAT